MKKIHFLAHLAIKNRKLKQWLPVYLHKKNLQPSLIWRNNQQWTPVYFPAWIRKCCCMLTNLISYLFKKKRPEWVCFSSKYHVQYQIATFRGYQDKLYSGWHADKTSYTYIKSTLDGSVHKFHLPPIWVLQ